MSGSRASLLAFGMLVSSVAACGNGGPHDGGTAGGDTTGQMGGSGSAGGTGGSSGGGSGGGRDAGCGGIHCNPITPICDGVVCRQCLRDSDCHTLTQTRCLLPDAGLPDPFGKAFQCHQCLRDDDCVDAGNRNGPICDALNYDTLYTCTSDCRVDAGPDSGPACPTPADGGGILKLYCNPNSGQCVGCIGDNDCFDPQRPLCDVHSGACVQCKQDADCLDGGSTTPFCFLETGGRPGRDDHTCVECRNAYDCPVGFERAGCEPAGPTPESAGHYCGRCNIDADCRAGPGRDAGDCLINYPFFFPRPATCGCPLSSDSVPFCGGDTPTCVGEACGCLGMSDCAGLVCDKQNFVFGACVAYCGPDAPCDRFPNSPVCNPSSGVCVGCLSDADCGGGQICDLDTSICRFQCASGNGCPPSQPFCHAPGTHLCYQC
jgi:Cys-rich repeat protein